ncbi:MAG: DUF3459 domain-containing protein [Clostridia bacterium]|nr:DUF3459 domain-containing protein [Clostridia bacterium]
MLIFNPLESQYKVPFGAVCERQKIKFSVFCRSLDCTELFLCLHDEDGNPLQRLAMQWECAVEYGCCWTVEHAFETAGLYHYRLEAVIGGRTFCYGCGDGQRAVKNGSLWQQTVWESGFETPQWMRGGVMYQIFPDRFCVGRPEKPNPFPERELITDPATPPAYVHLGDRRYPQNNDYYGGDLAGICSKLPYLASLGVTVLYLNPIFEAHSNHRYNTADYRRIDPMLGTEEDFRTLCREAKKQGISVVLDGVFSHTGDDSVYFNRYGRYDSVGAAQTLDSPYARWYRFKNHPDEYDCWWDVPSLPNVNETDAAYDAFINGEDGVIRYWLRQGASGWRLDVADELPEQFIRNLRKAARSEKSDALVLGEVWENASNKISYGKRRHYLLGRELDSVMNYPIAEAIIRFVRCGDARGLMRQLTDLASDYPPQVLSVLMNHLGTHDTARLITRLAGEPENGRGRDWMARTRLSAQQYALGLRKVKAASVVQYLIYGVPCVYYGDEIGMQGYGDPFCRAFYDWENGNADLREHYRRLGALRKDHPMLADAEFVPICAEGGLIAFMRRKNGKRLLCAVNCSQTPAELTVPFAVKKLLSGDCMLQDRALQLQPDGWFVGEDQ